MRATLATVLSSSLLLVACGGGGGSSGTTPQLPTLTISATNQDAVSRATAVAATAMLGAGGGVNTNSSASLSATTTATGGSGPGHSLASLVRYAARTLADPISTRRTLLAAGASPATHPLANEPAPAPCSVSGSVTISFTDADNDGIPEIGDTMTLSFSQCKETLTDTINGSMAVTLSSFAFPNNLLSFSGTLALQQLTVTDGARSAVLNGSLSLTYVEQSSASIVFTLSVGAAGMSAGVSGGGITDTVSFDADFALSETDTLVTAPGASYSSATLVGSFSASSIGGRVTLQSPTAVLQMDNEAFPRSGAMRVLGSGSALQLTALDATSVHVELDANGDGTYEGSKNVPWATLLPG